VDKSHTSRNGSLYTCQRRLDNYTSPLRLFIMKSVGILVPVNIGLSVRRFNNEQEKITQTSHQNNLIKFRRST